MTNGFIGEFLILLGTYSVDKFFAYVAVSGVVLGAVYMLWMFKKMFFGEKGELVKDEKHPLHDLSVREICVMVPLVLMVFWMGLFPKHFLKYSETSITFLVNNKTNYMLTFKDSEKYSEKFSLKDIDNNTKLNNQLQASGVTK